MVHPNLSASFRDAHSPSVCPSVLDSLCSLRTITNLEISPLHRVIDECKHMTCACSYFGTNKNVCRETDLSVQT